LTGRFTRSTMRGAHTRSSYPEMPRFSGRWWG
jgi:hypothetical protein